MGSLQFSHIVNMSFAIIKCKGSINVLTFVKANVEEGRHHNLNETEEGPNLGAERDFIKK